MCLDVCLTSIRRTFVLGLILALLGAVGSAKADSPPPLKVCLVSGAEDHHSDDMLASYQKYLEAHYPVRTTLLKACGFESLPGLESLDDCDVALFFTRRLRLPEERLSQIKKYVLSGKPIVAVRTASHGFQNWLEFDKVVLGGSYQGEHAKDKTQHAKVAETAKGHPILAGVVDFYSPTGLFRTAPLADDAEILMVGTSPGLTQPVAWIRTYHGTEKDARVFYTSLGKSSDWENSTFLRLVTNALFWTAQRDIPDPMLPELSRRVRREGTLRIPLRTWVKTFKGSDMWDEVTIVKELPVAETAILICDVWDRIYCTAAAKRSAAIAEKIAPVITAARAKGVQIIHSPSNTMPFYADWPQRRRMQMASYTAKPRPADISEPPLPIDDTHGPCESDDLVYPAYTRQHAAIPIAEPDGISDDGTEVYNFLRQEGIKNLIIMGVHTNMCILARGFTIREMTRSGIPCTLVRDLTDAMYDPRDPPYVSHERGTELVIEHIEKYWAPTTTSEELVRGLPER